jgi:hypothetical protein
MCLVSVMGMCTWGPLGPHHGVPLPLLAFSKDLSQQLLYHAAWHLQPTTAHASSSSEATCCSVNVCVPPSPIPVLKS